MKRRKNKLHQNALFVILVVLIILYAINILVSSRIIPAKTEEQTRLHLVMITNDCKSCFDMQSIVSFIKSQDVKIVQERNLSYASAEARSLVLQNGIKSLPALIVTGQISQPDTTALWERFGAKPANNAVVISGIPPYYNLSSQKIEGIVQVIMLTDNSCAECYNAENHMQILPKFGVYVGKSSTYDTLSDNGKELLQKYKITKVPTIVMSPDVSVYPAIAQIWSRIGTIESDGWYVFRATEQMGTYKDLEKGTVVNATR